MELFCITVFKVKVTAKVQNISECLFRWYLLIRRTFCHQTWCGVWCSTISQNFMQNPTTTTTTTKIACYLQSQGHSEGSYDQNMTFSFISSELFIFRQPNWSDGNFHKPECLVKKKKNYCIQGEGTAKVKMSMFVQMIASEPPHILFQTWYFEASSWARMSCKTFGLLFSRSRLQQGLIRKYDSFYYIFWTADPFATKLGLIVHYHKPECLMEKLECCVQGQGHSKSLIVSECFIESLCALYLLYRWFLCNHTVGVLIYCY